MHFPTEKYCTFLQKNLAHSCRNKSLFLQKNALSCRKHPVFEGHIAGSSQRGFQGSRIKSSSQLSHDLWLWWGSKQAKEVWSLCVQECLCINSEVQIQGIFTRLLRGSSFSRVPCTSGQSCKALFIYRKDDSDHKPKEIDWNKAKTEISLLFASFIQFSDFLGFSTL